MNRMFPSSKRLKRWQVGISSLLMVAAVFAQEEQAPESGMEPSAEVAQQPRAGFTPPVAPEPQRYQKLADPSPFTTRPSESLDEGIAPPPEMTLVGIMTIGGKINVWVQPTGIETPIQLVEGGPMPEGSNMKLIRVTSPNNIFTASAEIEANGQLVKVGFTESSVALAPGAGAPKQSGNRQGHHPNQPTPNPGQAQPQAQPQTVGQANPNPQPPPTVTPRRRIVLPK